jgi:hypothetical protein
MLIERVIAIQPSRSLIPTDVGCRQSVDNLGVGEDGKLSRENIVDSANKGAAMRLVKFVDGDASVMFGARFDAELFQQRWHVFRENRHSEVRGVVFKLLVQLRMSGESENGESWKNLKRPSLGRGSLTKQKARNWPAAGGESVGLNLGSGTAPQDCPCT